MNKRYLILIITIIVLLVSTVALASSNIKLIVNGKESNAEVKVMNGTSYVPLREAANMLGADVNWDSATKTVSINQTKEIYYVEESNDDILLNFKQFSEAAYNNLNNNGINVRNASVNVDQYGAYVSLEYETPNDSSAEDLKNNLTVMVSLITILEKVDGTVIRLFSDNEVISEIFVSYSDAKDFVDKKTDQDEFVNTWVFFNLSSNDPKETKDTTDDVMCDAINSKYDMLIRQTEEEHGARGMGRSSALDDAIKELEKLRNVELEANNCR